MDKLNQTFCLEFPLKRTHCGIVMGNGNFGAIIWGEKNLHITVNRSDFWDHRGGEFMEKGTDYKNLVKVAEEYGCGEALADAIPRSASPEDIFKPQRLPVGRFEFSFVNNITPAKAVLDYNSGEIILELSDGSRLTLNLSLQDNILLLSDEKQRVSGIDIKPSWDFPQVREWLEAHNYVPPERIEKSDFKAWIQACPEDPSLACVCERGANGYVIALELGKDNAEALQTAKKKLFNIDKAGILAANSSWWEKYWTDAPELNFPDGWFNCFFKYSLYKFAAATHPDGYACALQGPWHEEYQKAQWSGDYHFNVNVQEVYGLAFSTGKLEHLMPLFDMIESEPFINALKNNADALFGIDDGLWFTHAVDDRGQQCGWLSPGATLDPACGAWTAQLYWKYFLYSQDRDFLENRALPFIKGIMRGYEEMLIDQDGQLSIPLGISAEYGSSNPEAGKAGRAPSYQLAAAHMLADYLLEASRILDRKPKAVWVDIKKRLPHFTIIEGKDPYGGTEKRIAIWEGQDLDVCHRHHSHLACVYPFETLSFPTLEEKEIIDNSIDHWIIKGMGQWSEWCIPWSAIIYTRLGFTEAPMTLFNIWKEVFVNEGMATVYLPRFQGLVAHRRHDMKKPKETSEIMQLDGTFGAATALIEMMAYQAGDTIYLFKGVPEKWDNISFRNIHLPNGVTVSAERKNSQVNLLSVTHKYGGDLKFELNGNIKNYDFSPGETITF